MTNDMMARMHLANVLVSIRIAEAVDNEGVPLESWKTVKEARNWLRDQPPSTIGEMLKSGGGFVVTPDAAVPRGEIHFKEDGKLVGKIMGAGLRDPTIQEVSDESDHGQPAHGESG